MRTLLIPIIILMFLHITEPQKKKTIKQTKTHNKNHKLKVVFGG